MQLPQQVRITTTDQRPGRIGCVAQTRRKERVVPATPPALGCRELGLQALRRRRCDLGQDLVRNLRRRHSDQVLVAEAEQFGRAPADSAGRDLFDVRSKVSK
jgi:hypothetical protein